MVFTKSYMVYLPEGYDGLVFAAELEEDNYEDFMKRKQWLYGRKELQKRRKIYETK